MPTTSITKIKTKQNNLFLRVARGHFATNSSHSNYYIDVAAQKSRLSEAKAIATSSFPVITEVSFSESVCPRGIYNSLTKVEIRAQVIANRKPDLMGRARKTCRVHH